MYEITVSAPNRDRHILDHIKLQTASEVVKIDGLVTSFDAPSRCYYAVACSDTYGFQLKNLFVQSVAQSVALGYKNIFVRQCLNVSRCDFFQNVLINTMCVFDESYDSRIVEKILDIEKPVYIDGYYNFKMQSLKHKWKEIAKLVCENNYILHDKQLVEEFLQYLLESVDSKISHLTLTLEVGGFLMYDSQNNILPNMPTLAPCPTIEEEAAVNIILLKPRRLTVMAHARPSDDFCELLQLFDNELKIVD